MDAETRPDSLYRIPTRPVDAVVVLEGGRREEVTFYLSTVSETRAGPEMVDEALDRPRAFLPVRSRATGKHMLLRRQGIETITVKGDKPALASNDNALATSVDVRLELGDGTVVEGALATILPAENPRLSDYFNLNARQFVPVSVDGGVTYVNRELIAIVWL